MARYSTAIALLICMGCWRSDPSQQAVRTNKGAQANGGKSINADLAKRLIGGWEMADGSNYVMQFTREGTMSIRNGAGEPQVLMADDENLPYTFISETVVGVPRRSLTVPDNLVGEEEGFFLVFSVSIEQDRLTLHGQEGGQTIILSQDGVKKVRFPGSVPNSLEFVRQK
jgi:hypothetical protein